ncbi:MAG: hypothetical protein U0R64_05780 [Candidatus Nanopelagicales bacterium]
MRWRRRRRRLLALLSFRNEMRFLPGYFANVSPHVDGIIALDDGSTDQSAAFVARQPKVLRLLSHPAHEDTDWNDAENHRELVEASWDFGPSWLLGLDADERVERQFRKRAERIISGSDNRAYAVTVRELWDGPLQFRADGIWGQKWSARLFEARRDHQFHRQRLHCHWAPLNSRVDGTFPRADLTIYHLRMMWPADREARRRRYTTLDPTRRFQAIGYDYLTDETDLRLEPVAPDRAYEPLPTATVHA